MHEILTKRILPTTQAAAGVPRLRWTVADTTFKARLYASLGVREYWVIDAISLTTHVYRSPSEAGYAVTRAVPANEAVTASFVPSFAMRLADLRLK